MPEQDSLDQIIERQYQLIADCQNGLKTLPAGSTAAREASLTLSVLIDKLMTLGAMR